MQKKVLILTYYWPPSGGAGVQRWVKFAKYLPGTGWEPIILTVDPAYAAYPVTDDSLAGEIHPSTEVHRTPATDYFSLFGRDKSRIPSAGFAGNPDNSVRGKLSRFIRGNFFIPDPRKGWNKYAIRKAAELIGKYSIEYLITTSPPHSTQMAGLKLKKMFPGIKWIADLRDPWTDIFYYELFYPSFIARRIDGSYERNVFEKADRIITVGENLARSFTSKYPPSSGKITILTNGYDEEDFKDASFQNPERFTITYAGTLSGAYPLESLLTALKSISSGKDFLFRIVGTLPRDIKEKIIEHTGAGKAQFIPYCAHSEVIRLTTGSSMLLLVIPESANAKVITTGKVFEYIAARKPVLCIGPADGDAASVLRRSGQDSVFSGKDPSEIEKFILDEMENGSGPREPHPEFSRKNITGMLSQLLESI